MSQLTALQLMRAHQLLYYVYATPVWSDAAYDLFCVRHGLPGGGGSDSLRDYSEEERALAAAQKVRATDPLTLIDAPSVEEVEARLAEMDDLHDDYALLTQQVYALKHGRLPWEPV